MIGDATDTTNVKYTSIDGMPDDARRPTIRARCRGGVTDAGPDVGAWTSIVLVEPHRPRRVSGPRRQRSLKYAYESGGDRGATTSSIRRRRRADRRVRANGRSTAAATRRSRISRSASLDEMGHASTELRLARATSDRSAERERLDDLDVARRSAAAPACARAATSCVDGARTSQSCVTPTSDCAPGCGSGDVCNSGACVTAVADPAESTTSRPARACS